MKGVVLEAYTMTEFQKEIQKQLNKLAKTGKLYRSNVSGNEVWDMYIAGFEKDPIFRDPNSSEHNCNLCKNFIRRYGNIVAINDKNEISTIWDDVSDSEYSNSAKKISKKLKSSKIENVFFETFNELNSLNYEKCNRNNTVFRLGLAKNVKRYTKEEAEKFGVVKPNEIREFNHLHLDIPTQFVDMTGKSIEAIMSEYRDAKNVFQGAMETISLDTLNLVKDLINQGSLLDGTTHLFKIEQIIPLKAEYDELSAKERDNWCWLKSYKLPFAKFRNELIGVLCSELSEGLELNTACTNWNKRVDTANYMKATAPITKKQIEEAKKFVEENGYEESFNRRFATIDDIKVSEILHSNVGDGKIKSVSLFDGVKSTSTRHKRNEFDKVEEVNIEKFMKDILPGCTSIEAYLENRMENNMVSLTTANNPDSKPIFKWSNNYSWTYNGNLAGKSMIKQAVKDRGGNTIGVLNTRLHFPDTTDDYDLHMNEPKGGHIYYGNRRHTQPSSGMLDLDAQGADGHYPPDKRVENIIYTDINKMPQGKYILSINNYSGRGFKANFTLEIEIDGEITTLGLEKLMPQTNTIIIAEITLKNGNFEVVPSKGISIINSNSISKTVYGLETNQFHKVNLVCLSPNHWDGNNVGNKHYFFMLNDCKSPVSIRSFHVENLISELAQHRKVLEMLGNTTMINPSDKQLSGLGFNATVRDELILKVKGSHQRVLKIKF